MRIAVVPLGFGILIVAAARAQVNLPPGFETVEIAVDERFTSPPSINNCGQIVYSKEETVPPYGPEIYLYDNGRITQITHNDIPDDFPVINDAGDMAWIRYVPELDRVQLVFLRDGIETVVDEAWALTGVEINSSGHLVWSHYFDGNCNWDLRVMFWNGSQVTQITPPDEYYDQSPAINDLDDIVWTHMNVCVTPWTGRIQAFWDQQIVDLPSVDSQEQGSDISNSRHIVWSAGQDVVEFRNGMVNVVAAHGAVPKVNSAGEIYAPVWSVIRELWEPYVFVPKDRGYVAYRFGQGASSYTDGANNDYGEAACRWINDPVNGDWGGGILFLRRARTGDYNGDARTDHMDYQRMPECMNGPRVSEGLCECRLFDFDCDDDVDLLDFSEMQLRFDMK